MKPTSFSPQSNILLILSILGSYIQQNDAFIATNGRLPSVVKQKFRRSTYLRDRRRNPSNNNNDNEKEIRCDKAEEIPCLPAIGKSSFDATSIDLGGEASPVAHVADRFELQYTCNVCGTRNSHSVSRLAYRQGLVITFCKECESRHLIADNLGWTGHFSDSDGSIEEHYETIGRGDEVNRVSKEVFDLEKSLHAESKGGSGGGEGEIVDAAENNAFE